MANITLTPAIINALAAFNALSREEQADFTQAIIAMSGCATVSAPTSAPVAPTQSAEQTKVCDTTPKECIDTEVHVECLGKGHIRFFTVGEDGKEGGVAVRYMSCVKGILGEDGYEVEYDKTFERAEVYKRDWTDPKTGETHKAGTHKHGAYMLKKGDKALAQATVSKWVKAHEVILVSADAAKAADDARIERNAKRNARKGGKA